MQSVSSQVASRSELLELVETLGFYARIEQPEAKQLQSAKLVGTFGTHDQRFPLQLKNMIGLHTVQQ